MAAGTRPVIPVARPGAEGTRMFAEAAEAADAVARQQQATRAHLARLGETLRRRQVRLAATCARGSSDHAATFAKYLIETRAGVPVASAAPSVSSVYRADMHLPDTAFISISQSGRSPDLVAAVQAARRAGAFTIALVNVEDSPLASIVDEVVPLCAGPETSVAATKSFITSLSAILGLVAAWTQDDDLGYALDAAPTLLTRAWALDWSEAVAALTPVQNLFVIGRGLGLGVAQEAALKFKETCQLHAEAFSSAEVRHGPMALVGPAFPALLLAQDDETLAGAHQFAAEFVARGAPLMLAGASYPGAVNLPTIEAPSALQPLLLIQSFYRMANALSVARGLDPDRPPHLNKVTRTL
jgi:glucosamine--fructose-6-phosphate aminotransferase (isomerizing)